MNAERRLSRAAAAHRSTRDRLTVAIREARADGVSLRKIAEATGMSHEQVRRLTQ